MQTVQHFIGALLLISAAWEHLHSGPGHGSVLPYFELAAGALLILSVVFEKLRKRHAKHGVAWVELAGAVMMFVEAVARTRERHHLSFLILQFVPPVFLVLFGVLELRTLTDRYFRADDDSLRARLRLVHRRRVEWKRIESFAIDGKTLRMKLAGGGRRNISLRDVKEREALSEWLRAQFAARGIAER